MANVSERLSALRGRISSGRAVSNSRFAEVVDKQVAIAASPSFSQDANLPDNVKVGASEAMSEVAKLMAGRKIAIAQVDSTAFAFTPAQEKTEAERVQTA
jgi:hypothetical protein